MTKRRRRHPVRRLLRALVLLVLLGVVYSVVVGYMPFSRAPKLSDDARARVEARVEEMSHDVSTGDRAAILETRTEALDERIRLINQAKSSLVITTYDCRDGESTRDILCAVLARAEAGVRVRMLIDGIAGRFHLMHNGMFRAVAAHPNVEVRFYNLFTYWQAWKHMGRMHDKYLIADDTAYILGGRNTFDYFLGEYPAPTHSLDREALVYNAAGSADSSLFEVLGYFEGVWDGGDATPFHPRVPDDKRAAEYAALDARREGLRAEKPELFAPADYGAVTVATRGVWLIHNPTTIYAKEPEAFAQLTGLMARAREEIIVHSPYAVLNDDSRATLSEIAARVPVTLMINAVENGQNVVASGDYLLHRDEVLSTGMRVLEYAGGDSYHGKSMVIDDALAVIGSFNLDLRSTYVDTELMLVIRSPELNATLRGHMAALHADCQERLPDGTAAVPDGLRFPPLTLGRETLLRLLGLAMQPVRNLV